MATTTLSACASRPAACSRKSLQRSAPQQHAAAPLPTLRVAAAAPPAPHHWRRQSQRGDAVRRRAGSFEWSELSVENFDEVVSDSPTPLLVAFHASWCRSCHQLGIAMQRLAPSVQAHVTFEKIDAETNRAVMARLGVKVLPTVVLFKGQGSADVLARKEGLLSKQDLELWLRSHLRF
ncbi:hypothetical protein ABPG77_005926 [Micractinium sp. CCAP 211/92]